MQSACGYSVRVTTLQVRDVPEDVSRTLKERAAASGRSLSEYALGILARDARQPTIAELTARIRDRQRIAIGGAAVELIRAEQALQDLAELPARRWPAKELSARVWELRHAMSAYDATYIALAESLDADLVTCDGRLARAAEGQTLCTLRALA